MNDPGERLLVLKLAGQPFEIGPGLACRNAGEIVQVHVTGAANGDTEKVHGTLTVVCEQQGAIPAGHDVDPGTRVRLTDASGLPEPFLCRDPGRLALG